MKKTKYIKVLALILTIAVTILIVLEIAPVFKNLATEQGRIIFKNKIENMGFKGIFIIIGLNVAQIFLSFLPR